MSLTLVLIHGWGYGAAFWDLLRAHLGDVSTVAADRGYFGEPHDPDITGPIIAIGHSHGAMELYAAPPSDCRAIIAINGFDCFTARSDFPGVPTRLIDRMLARLTITPDSTLTDFRVRCGDTNAFGLPDPDRLAAGLIALRNDDARGSYAGQRLPLLALNGAADPLLPSEMRAATFAKTVSCDRLEHPKGGHLLPLTHPAWCASQIRALMERCV